MIRDSDIRFDVNFWNTTRFFSMLAPEDIEFVSLDIGIASKVIENILVRIPLPSIYGYEKLNEFNKDNLSMFHLYTGHQIVRAVKQFIDNKFALTGMCIVPYTELEGLRCNDLNIRYQNCIREITFELHIMRYSSEEMITFMDEQIKLTIFSVKEGN
jgi:hypothetical protein